MRGSLFLLSVTRSGAIDDDTGRSRLVRWWENFERGCASLLDAGVARSYRDVVVELDSASSDTRVHALKEA